MDELQQESNAAYRDLLVKTHDYVAELTQYFHLDRTRYITPDDVDREERREIILRLISARRMLKKC